MNRIYEYVPTQEAAIVSRVLVAVHKAIDEQFPDAIKASRQFTKTVFSDTSTESTVADRAPAIPPPPGSQATSAKESGQDNPRESAKNSRRGRPDSSANANSDQPVSINFTSGYAARNNSDANPISGKSQFDDESGIRTIRTSSTDWIMRITIVALIGGIGYLAWLLYFQTAF